MTNRRVGKCAPRCACAKYPVLRICPPYSPTSTTSSRACGVLAERGLGRREAGDGDAERRAGDIVERELVAERDRGRVAAVLAADADLQLGARLAAALDADAHQFAHALAIDGDEGIAGENAARDVGAEKARGVV